jgi:hypothetical protein
MAAKDGSDAKQVAVPGVGSTHLDALVGIPRDAGRQEHPLLT